MDEGRAEAWSFDILLRDSSVIKGEFDLWKAVL
jgi:hypothetical protein